MSHRSRLAGFIIDSQVDDLPAASAFWSAALGLKVTDPDDGGLGIYDKFEHGPGGRQDRAPDEALALDATSAIVSPPTEFDGMHASACLPIA